MRQKTQQTRREAIERMRAERDRLETRDRRKRRLSVAGAVLGVVAIAAAIGVVVAQQGTNSRHASSGAAPAGAGGNGNLIIPVGPPGAPSTFDVYEDFRCPACGQFEARYHRTFNELIKRGQARVRYHVVSFIDNNVGGTGSKTAANAAACAQERGHFARFHDVLYANQPQETDDAFHDPSRLVALAQRVPGLNGDKAFEKCVRGGTFDGWVRRSQEAFTTSGFTTTPTVLLDGENILQDRNHQPTPEELAERVGQKSAAAPPVNDAPARP